MKRLLIFTLILTLTFTLSACGKKEQSESALVKDIVETSSVKDAPQIFFTAKNWEWDKEEYIVKANEPVTLVLDNKSGYHGMEIVDTGVNLMMNEPQTLVFKKPGSYTIRCSIMCGTDHAKMTATFTVQ